MSKKTNVLRDEAALVTRLKLIKECSTVNIRRLLSALQNCFVCRIPLETVLCVCSASSSSPVCSPFQSAERDGTFLACLVRDRQAGKLVFDALIRWVKIDYTSMDNVCSVSCRQAGHFLAHLTIRDH
ncbi:G kinase-anchoring protein [Trichinella pseudospiralis]